MSDESARESAREARHAAGVAKYDRELQLAKLRSSLSMLMGHIDPADRRALVHKLADEHAGSKIDMLLAAAVLHEEDQCLITELNERGLAHVAELSKQIAEATSLRDTVKLLKTWLREIRKIMTDEPDANVAADLIDVFLGSRGY